MSQPPEPDEQLDEAFAAYLRSCDTGEIDSREEFLSQFPELADDLRELMDAADMIGGITHAGVSRGPAVPPPQADTGAETIRGFLPLEDDSGIDPAATLPMANRPKGDPGPTLPFDLGDYELQEVIGRGGMGVVYLARQYHLDRMVAVKMIRSGMLAGEDEVKRFYTEAQAAARLHHSGIVSVYQFGHRAGHHFFSMAYIEGTDLQKKINGEALDPRDGARYVRDVALAIDHAHKNDVLHRDLKPANVLIDKEDQIHLTDFGLAKNLNADSSLTGSGAAVGTPHYMAPEQAGGHSDRANKQSDIYSIGAILFASITGRPPLVGDTVMQTLMQVVHNPAPPIRSICPNAPADLETIVAKCLEKNPAKRYQCAASLAADLDAFLEGRPISARPRSKVVKTLHWLERVPLIGALMGRDVVDTSRSHRRFQAAMIAIVLLTPLGLIGMFKLLTHYKNAMPTEVVFGGGLDGGVYNIASQRICDRLKSVHDVVTTKVIQSGGSFSNLDLLTAGSIHMAPMQESALRGDQLCVVAPMFYEAVHVLVRTDAEIDSIDDLKGRTVAVGPPSSGSHRTASLIFDSLELTNNIQPKEVQGWSELESPETPDAAVICIGLGSELVTRLLTGKRWKLIAIPTAIQVSLQHPTLRPMNIRLSEYTDATDGEVIGTVGTTALLATRRDVPDELVREVLSMMYQPPAVFPGLISRKHAAEWSELALHPEARRFFEKSENAAQP